MESEFAGRMDTPADKVDYDNLSHAYIISGPANSGKKTMAAAMAKAMVCSSGHGRPCGKCGHCRKAGENIHPDIIFVDREPDKRFIQVGQVRAIRGDAGIMPNEAEKKVYVINNADAMNTEAQNAMLSVLEEPPAHVAFILIAENIGLLLPTIRSRCVEVGMKPPEKQPEDGNAETAERLFELMESGDRAGLLKFLYGFEKADKADFAGTAAAVKRAAADRLSGKIKTSLSKRRLMDVLGVFDEAVDYMNANVSMGHITGLILAGLV